MEPISSSSKILASINKIYSNSAITKSLAQQIIKVYEELLLNFTESVSTKMKHNIPEEFHNFIDECLHENILQDFNSDWKFMRQLKKSTNFIAPESFLIGEVVDDKNLMGTIIWTKRKCYGQFISLRVTLKKFLELPNVFVQIINYMHSEMLKHKMNQSKEYTSIFQGQLWNTLAPNFEKNLVLPMYLYYDEFEVCDPLSSAAGLHKIGGLYCSIAALPPKFASTLDNVFLIQYIYNTDYKEFGAARCFTRVLSELQFLIQQGITINVNNKDYQVYFIMISLLGDNLAQNSLLGFNESSNSNYYCRFCTILKKDAMTSNVELGHLLRNYINYEEDLQLLRHGVKSKCIFNQLPFYHNTLNWSCDLMHDLYLGVCRYDMAKIIKHCISEKYFTLENLNNRLKFFNHSETDCGNKITSINDNHIRNEYLIVTAAEMSALVAYFGIIVGDLVEPDDPAWELYSVLFEIIDLVTNNTISEHDVIHLRELIKSHHNIYVNKLHGHLTPKFHILVHYPTLIKLMGPIKYLSCAKFEAFHRKAKKHAHVVNCRINILHTLATKLQLNLCSRFTNDVGFHNIVSFGQSVTTHKIKSAVTSNIVEDFEEFRFININGTIYRPSYAIYLENDSYDNPKFGIISRVISNRKKIIFIYKEATTMGYNSNIKAYNITLPSTNSKEKTFLFDFNNYINSLKIHVTSNGYYVISRRCLL